MSERQEKEFKSIKSLSNFCLFYSHIVESCSRLFPLLHYCGNSSLDISLPLINIIVIVYYADLSCDMQELALIGQFSSPRPLIG